MFTPSPPDLEIRVTTGDGQSETRLSFVLHSALGKVDHFESTIEGKKIRGRPEQYQAALLATIESWHAGRGTDGSLLHAGEITSQLEALGHELYDELFPPELQTAYRGFRRRVETLLLISDEPWIPWELVKPYDDGDPDDLIDDDFLCCQFQFTRWLAGGKAPAAVIGARQLACIEAGAPPDVEPLPHADAERGLFAAVAERHPGVEDHSLADATHPRVEALLRRGGSGVLHFVGHGELASDPNESRFLLCDARSLRPRDLHGPIRTHVKRDRPLVFFNSCQVARQGFTLTRLGGWTARWVRDCGCGAFVGPLWTVNDALAHTFATVFYAALERGETFGQAALAARREVRQEAAGRPSWLALTVYAHPNGRLRLGFAVDVLPLPVRTWRPDRSPPGALLRADYGVVPFHFRDQEVEDLDAWCRDEAAAADLHRQLAAERPEIFEPLLARNLEHLARLLERQGRTQEASAVRREVLDLHRTTSARPAPAPRSETGRSFTPSQDESGT